jgi:cytoskeletal protein CcmA (bactofilin family)
MSSRVKDSGTLSVSTIGADLTITGNVTSKGEIQLDGHAQGDIHCVSLTLGESASVEGNVTADDVVLRGAEDLPTSGRRRSCRFSSALWERGMRHAGLR